MLCVFFLLIYDCKKYPFVYICSKSSLNVLDFIDHQSGYETKQNKIIFDFKPKENWIFYMILGEFSLPISEKGINSIQNKCNQWHKKNRFDIV